MKKAMLKLIHESTLFRLSLLFVLSTTLGFTMGNVFMLGIFMFGVYGAAFVLVAIPSIFIVLKTYKEIKGAKVKESE